MKNNAINTYLKELSKQLCCSGKEKKEILSSLKNRLSEFESEHPTDLKYEDIVEQFGSPKEVANSFLGEYSSTHQGYLTLRGKVPTKYFVKRFYGVEDTCEILQEEGKEWFHA